MSLFVDIWKSFRSWVRRGAESARLREAAQANQRKRLEKQRELIDSLPIVPRAASGPLMSQSQLAPIIESIKSRDDISNATKRMLVESLPIQPDWLTPWQDWLSSLQFDGWWPIITGLTGKAQGSDHPFFRSEMELQILRDISRALYKTNNHAQGLELGLRSYTIRKGYKVTVTDRDGQDPELQAKTQLFIDRFIAKNQLYQRERESFTRTMTDGEAFLRIFAAPQEDQDRVPVVRFVWPEQIKQPHSSDVTWTYGCHNKPGDIESITEYAVFALDGTANHEVVDARNMCHIKRGVLRGVKRGVPYFVWGEKDAIEQSGKVERNLGHGSAIQAAIAYVVEHAFGSKSEIEQSVLDNVDYTEGRIYQQSNPTRGVQQFEPGLIVHTSKNEQFKESPFNQGVSGHIEVAKLLMRSAQSKSCAPAWLGSADASDMGAYTSSLVAESPFVMGIESDQDDYAAAFMKLIRRAVELGIEAALLPEGTLTRIEIKQEVLSPVARDRQVEANINHTRLEDQTTTPQQVIREAGMKPEDVIKEWKEWREAGMGKDAGPQQQAPGQENGDGDSLLAQALGGGDDERGQGAKIDDPPKLPKQPGGFESVIESFDEGKHARDDHGRFVAHGEIDAAKSDPAKADELRKRVTNPEERKKLDAALKDGSESSSFIKSKLPTFNINSKDHVHIIRELRKALDNHVVGDKRSEERTYGELKQFGREFRNYRDITFHELSSEQIDKLKNLIEPIDDHIAKLIGKEDHSDVIGKILDDDSFSVKNPDQVLIIHDLHSALRSHVVGDKKSEERTYGALKQFGREFRNHRDITFPKLTQRRIDELERMLSPIVKLLPPHKPSPKYKSIHAESIDFDPFLPLGDYADGIDDETYVRLTEAQRSGLVKKTITNKLGKKQTVWVKEKPDAPKQQEKPAAAERPSIDGTLKHVEGLRQNFTTAGLVELANALHSHTVGELKAIKEALGLKASGRKVELAKKIAERALATPTPTQAKEPEAKPAEKPAAATPAKAPAKKAAPATGKANDDVANLYDRAASASDEEIAALPGILAKMSQQDLLATATKMEMKFPASTSKKKLAEKIHEAIVGRKGASQRARMTIPVRVDAKKESSPGTKIGKMLHRAKTDAEPLKREDYEPLLAELEKLSLDDLSDAMDEASVKYAKGASKAAMIQQLRKYFSGGERTIKQTEH